MKLLRTTLLLNYCWVCERRFKSSVPPGPAIRHDHHIVPRNAGGEDGPLVSLCDTHHSVVHRLAERAHLKQDVKDLLTGEEPRFVAKLVWLAKKVYDAEIAVQDDPNKHLGVSFKLSAEEVRVLDALRVRFGNVSRKQLVLLGLRALSKQLEQ